MKKNKLLNHIPLRNQFLPSRTKKKLFNYIYLMYLYRLIKKEKKINNSFTTAFRDKKNCKNSKEQPKRKI